MGHYDGCYDADADEAYEKELLELNLEIKAKLEELDIGDLKIVSKILTKLPELKSFYKVLKNGI